MKVLISPGYGAGWSTWNNPALATDSRIIDAFEKGISEEEMKELCIRLGLTDEFGDVYMGGFGDLMVVDVPAGELFQIQEYDGYESIELFDSSDWIVAI